MVNPTEMQILALSLLTTCDKIIHKKLNNIVAKGFWNKMGKPFITKSILETPDNELTDDLNEMFKRLKPHFDKKGLKDMIDEANELSDIKLDVLNNKTFNEASKYF
jgi:hypothetical protein